MAQKTPLEKIEKMRRMRAHGLTLEEIGRQMVPSISRERVRQLIGNTGGGRYPKKGAKA